MMRLKSVAVAIALASALASPSAFAWVAGVADVTVTDQITLSNSSWNYNYTVTNASWCLGNCSDTRNGEPIGTAFLGTREFSVPFFDDAQITDIASPFGWSYNITNVDTFSLGQGAGTLTWSAASVGDYIASGASRNGFSYNTAFAPGKGPFQAVIGAGSSIIGDPAVPLSPKAIAAGIESLNPPSQVPEPQSMLLMLAGIGLLAASRAVRRAK